MKIAITAIHYALVGGTERYLYNLVAGFKALGDSVDVYIYGKQTEQSCDQVQILRRSIPKIIPRILRQRIFVNRTRQLKQLDYDLTISLARTCNASLTIAGSTHIGYTDTINKKLSYKDKLTIKMERESYTSCKNLISHSQQIAEELQQYYQLPQRKITNIYPPLDHQKFLYKKHQLTQSTRERFGVSPNKTVFLFPSTGHWRKGLYELLAAFKSLDPEQTELLIVGSKPKNICPPDNVKYLGLISDMPALYAASDYTILPSKYEPFGYVVPESLACGTPVIISDKVGAQEIISEGEGLVFTDISPEGILTAIQTAMRSDFTVAPDFIQRKQLMIDDHVRALKSFA